MVFYSTRGNRRLIEYNRRFKNFDFEVLEINKRGKIKMSEDEVKDFKPDYIVSSPVEKKDGKTFWQNIGSAWDSKKGISIVLNALPLSSKIMLFKYEEREKK